MSLQLITDAASEPITLVDAKLQCRVDGATEDALITSYIKAARKSCEEFCNRAFFTQTWREVLNEFPLPTPLPGSNITTSAIVLNRGWVRSITSVKYIDNTGTEVTLSAPSYRLVSTPKLPGRLVPAYGVSWPAVRADEGVITVDFVAGWETVELIPDEIKQAIRFLTAHFYNNRESVIVGSIATELPQAVEHLLWPHRIF